MRLLTFILATFSLSVFACAEETLAPVTSSRLIEVLNDRSAFQGCRIVARISVDTAKKVGTAACPIPDPTPINDVACVVGLVLQKKKYAAAAETGVTEACSWAVEKVSDKVIEVSIEIKKDTKQTASEIKSWIEFLNTTGGAIWFANEIARGL